MAAKACVGRDALAVDSLRAGPLEEDLDCNRREAFAFLSETVRDELRRLQAFKAACLDGPDRLDREEAPLRALFDDSKEATLQVRYERERGLELHRALNQLVALKKLDVATEPLPPLEAPSETASPEPVRTSEPEAAPRNDPKGAPPQPSRRALKALRRRPQPRVARSSADVPSLEELLRARVPASWLSEGLPDTPACEFARHV